MMKMTPRLGLLVVSLLCFCALIAQDVQLPLQVKIKPCCFKGKWQLVQTYALGSLHAVKKEDYDGVICLRCFHRYYEEVHYESNHWIIAGKWHVNRSKGTLELTQRNYTLGKLEEHPGDVTYDIVALNRKSWTGGIIDKGQAVKVYYSRIVKMPARK